MMAATHEGETPAANCADDTVRKAKGLTLNRMIWRPILNSISRFINMFGGAMFGAGLLGMIRLAAGRGLGTTAVVMTVVGGVLETAGICLDYVANRFWQSTGLDQTEIGALSTAETCFRTLQLKCGAYVFAATISR